MFTSPLHVRTINRPLAFAGCVALAAILLVPSVATASPGATAAATGNRLAASVTGSQRTGMWRIRVVAPGGNRRVDFVVRSGDITWNGTVRVSRVVEGRWTTIRTHSLSGTTTALRPASGTAAGVSWNTTQFQLPNDGNSRFTISAELTRHGTYRVIGSVRNATEAFSYGSWSSVGSSSITR